MYSFIYRMATNYYTYLTHNINAVKYMYVNTNMSITSHNKYKQH